MSRRIKLIGETPLPTEFGGWTYLVFEDLKTYKFHTLLVYKRLADIAKHPNNVLVRIHSACASSELFHANNCECREELEEGMKRIKRNGRGIIVYLDHEGAGNGIAAKLMVYSKTFGWKNGRIVQKKDPKTNRNIDTYTTFEKLGYKKEARTFEVAAEMLKYAGVKSVKLMTNNPKKVEGIERYGIPAIPISIHIKPKNRIVSEHLRSKAVNLGHKISERHIKM